MVGSLIIVMIEQDLFAKESGKANNDKVMTRFNDIYEPSGVQQLADGRIVVVQDEKSRGISHLLVLGSGNSVQEIPLRFDLRSSQKVKLGDLEGIAVDADGNVFAITSHARSKKGKLKPNRERLVRFRIEGNLLTDVDVFDGIGTFIRRKLDVNAINIEAISFDSTRKKLLVGLREPVLEGNSVIVVLENPNGIFARHEQPRFSDQVFKLDLSGGGIRALDFNQKLGGYLLANEVQNPQGKKRSRFWFWDGNAANGPRIINLPGMQNIKNIEGLTFVAGDAEPRILIVSDDGKIHKQKGAHYAVLGYSKFFK